MQQRSQALWWLPVTFFFLIAYAIAWLIALTVGVEPEVLRQDFSPLTAFFLITLPKFAFSLAGLVMIVFTQGKKGLQELKNKLLYWRLGLHWYALAYLGPALLYGFGVILVGLHNPAILSEVNLNANTPWMLLFGVDTGILTYVLLRAGLGEEIGLRGFALPNLQRHMSPFKASLIIGILWAAWHLPAWWDRDILSLSITFVVVIGLSFVFTSVYKQTDKSLMIVMLLHAAINSFDDVYETIFPALQNEALWELPFILSCLIIGVIIAWRLGLSSRRRRT